jgi:ATP-dependent Lhr-like helicase
VRARLEQDDEIALPVAQEGRWGLVHRFGVLGKALPREEQAARQARQLLARYGVVTHASLDNEEGAWEWPAIYQELQRLEMRGEVRRGYFVEGLPGVQFAAPEAVERLRGIGGGATEEDDALVVMNACDPANFYGSAETAQPALADATFTFARLPSTWLVMQRGMPVVLLEGTGAQITTAEGTDEGVVARAVQGAFQHIGGFERTIKVEQWNGEPVLQSTGQPILEACGFYRDFPGMTLG